MKKVIYAVLAFSPTFAFAADLTNISNLVSQFGGIVAKIIPIMFAIAIIYFFWGLIVFLRAAGDKAAQEAGKNHMIYGVIAIAVMVSIYGLVNFLTTSVGITPTNTTTVPTVPGLGQ